MKSISFFHNHCLLWLLTSSGSKLEAIRIIKLVRHWPGSKPTKVTYTYISTDIITSTQEAADRGALRICRRVSLSEGGQKFWLQWQLADTAWLACARVGATRSAAARLSNAPTHPLQWSHPHLNSIFASKLHARAPLHWVICIRLIRWHGAHLQAVVIVMEILLPDPEKLPSSLWSRNLKVLLKLMSGHVIAYAGDLNFYHNIPSFFAGVSNSIF